MCDTFHRCSHYHTSLHTHTHTSLQCHHCHPRSHTRTHTYRTHNTPSLPPLTVRLDHGAGAVAGVGEAGGDDEVALLAGAHAHDALVHARDDGGVVVDLEAHRGAELGARRVEDLLLPRGRVRGSCHILEVDAVPRCDRRRGGAVARGTDGEGDTVGGGGDRAAGLGTRGRAMEGGRRGRDV